MNEFFCLRCQHTIPSIYKRSHDSWHTATDTAVDTTATTDTTMARAS